jgi:hypothetical protein
MKARLDALAAACLPLQVWHGAATWILAFDLADGWEETSYEAMSVRISSGASCWSSISP